MVSIKIQPIQQFRVLGQGLSVLDVSPAFVLVAGNSSD